jgi:cyclophilin family peptidyl-prolyl cis-trans isomerase
MADIKDPENTILLELKDGTVTIELLPDIAPKHCERMKELARSGAYDNVCFHRVIDGFMAQTGDVANGNMEKDFNIRAAGTGGSLEFHMIAVQSALRARKTLIPRTASSSSTSLTTTSSTNNTRFMAA